MKRALFGLIYLSAYKIQLNIVNLKDLTIIEKIDSPSFLQADAKSRVFEQDMDKICTALEGFKEKIAEYKIKNYKFYGNEQLIGKLAASFIAEQIEVRTGLKIEWPNGGQILYAKVLSGLKSLRESGAADQKQMPTYLLSLGSAMINLSLFKNNKYVFSWSLPLGPREVQDLTKIANATPTPIDVMNDYLGAKIGHLARQIKDKNNVRVIIQHADALSSVFLPQENTTRQITREEYYNFYNKIISMPLANIMQTYHLESAVAAHTIPNAISIHQFLSLVNVKTIYITDRSVITGLLLKKRLNLVKDLTMILLWLQLRICQLVI